MTNEQHSNNVVSLTAFKRRRDSRKKAQAQAQKAPYFTSEEYADLFEHMNSGGEVRHWGEPAF